MAASSPESVLIYADGSCEGNPGPGGWGVVIVTPQGKQRISGGDSHTTNNRMEIMAAIEALRALDSGVPVILRSDSQYLVKTMNEGWRRTKNQDLWKRLDQEVARHDVRFEWVRGHDGDAGNEEADGLAREAAREAALSRAPASAAGRSTGSQRPAASAWQTESTASPAPAAHPAPSDDELLIAEIRGLLEPGERIVNCKACKRAFITRGDQHYCPLIACQMIKRK